MIFFQNSNVSASQNPPSKHLPPCFNHDSITKVFKNNFIFNL